jgi:hypothetical protein
MGTAWRKYIFAAGKRESTLQAKLSAMSIIFIENYKLHSLEFDDTIHDSVLLKS